MHTAGQLPPESIRTDRSNRFAHYTMSVRLPSIIDEVLEVNPDYPPVITESLRRLKAEVLDDQPMRSIVPPAPDWGLWEEQLLRHPGESWLHGEWFFAEHLFYRRIIEAVRWWETGRDPFLPIKEREYDGDGYNRLLQAVAEGPLSARVPEACLESLLLFDLWGNRVDLSHKVSAALGARAADSTDLVVDERPRILDLLLGSVEGARVVHIVTDNAGSELSMDLLLAGALVELGFGVAVHVKMHPTYVSDATASDVRTAIRRLCDETRPLAVVEAGRRVWGAFEGGTIRIVPDLFWNSGRFLEELPPRLAEPLRSARLLILKGDVNYRRLSRDAVWAPDARPEGLFSAFIAPTALLRTMKSDTVIALPSGLAERLDDTDSEWKSNGKRGIIQCFG